MGMDGEREWCGGFYMARRRSSVLRWKLLQKVRFFAWLQQGTKRLVPLGVFGDLLRETLFTQVKYFYAAVFLLVDSLQKGIAFLIRFASFSSACREMICFACSMLSRHMQRGARPETG
jgi:hypothetical protein